VNQAIDNRAHINASGWYVNVSGQIYGPYHEDNIRTFIQEGRIVENSMLSQTPSQGFHPAAHTPFFNQPSAPLSGNVPNAGTLSEPSVYLIMAEIGSGQAMQFLHLIQKLGSAQRIGDSVWLIKSAMPIEDLKNQLAATLTKQDRLFILDSRRNQTAWFNIGADMGQRIDALWNSVN